MDESSVIARLNRYLFSGDFRAMVEVGIGAVLMFFPWLLVSSYPRAPQGGGYLWHTLNYGPQSFIDLIWTDSAFRGPLLVFLAGTIIAVFTRIGGLVQGSGLIGFVLAARPGFINNPPSYVIIPRSAYDYYFYIFMIGYLLAVVSTMVVMFGGRRFAWNARDYGNVPANGRTTALLPHATRVMR